MRMVATTDSLGAEADRHGIPLDARPKGRRHVGRWIAGVLVVALVAVIGVVFARSEIKWSEVPHYVVSSDLLNGVVGTLKLTLATMVLGIVLGTLIAVARQSANPLLRTVGTAYVWLFRGVPALVQLLLWFNIALVLPRIDLGPVYSGQTNQLMTPFVAALLGLGLSEAAYMAEIVRSGILSVPHGQVEAAKSMGMNNAMTMRRVVLPQAIPVIIPPTGNEFINMLKYTSLAFAVSYSDLLSQAQRIYTSNFEVMEVLLSATVWYLVLCTVCSLIQARIEKYFAAGASVSARARAKLEQGTI